MQSVFCVPDSDAVAVEILLSWPVNFELHVHLPVLQVTRLHEAQQRFTFLLQLAKLSQKKLQKPCVVGLSSLHLLKRLNFVCTVLPHHSVPDRSLLASLIRSESDVRACDQRASPEVPLTADPYTSHTSNRKSMKDIFGCCSGFHPPALCSHPQQTFLEGRVVSRSHIYAKTSFA